MRNLVPSQHRNHHLIRQHLQFHQLPDQLMGRLPSHRAGLLPLLAFLQFNHQDSPHRYQPAIQLLSLVFNHLFNHAVFQRFLHRNNLLSNLQLILLLSHLSFHLASQANVPAESHLVSHL